jgi:hypothetical protein
LNGKQEKIVGENKRIVREEEEEDNITEDEIEDQIRELIVGEAWLYNHAVYTLHYTV